jgi:general L-amino acid transport system permease protein
VKPPVQSGLIYWLRKNLFRTWFDTLLTFLMGYVAVTAGAQFLQWAVVEANWQVVVVNFRVLMQGQYPGEFGGRLALAVVLIVVLAGVSWGIWGRLFRTTLISLGLGVGLLVLLPPAARTLNVQSPYLIDQLIPMFDVLAGPVVLLVTCLGIGYGIGRAAKRINRQRAARLTLIGWFVLIPAAFVLVRGFAPGSQPLPLVPTNLWGGLLLTFMLAFVAIVACFPLGVLLALGRTSGGPKGKLGRYPVIKLFCIAYIEFLRGVPLVTVFFTANLIVPLALGDNSIDAVVRAMVALTLFEAAYIAEIVRGGLQAIPPGQVEAARAIGLSPVQATLFIILPQAIRIVIPTLVGQFITMFKDTSLVAIIGLFDLLGLTRSVLAQPEFTNNYREAYIFVAAVYFVFSYGMSYAARQLEKTGSGRFRRT